MSAMVIEGREMIVQAVLDGYLGAEHITDEELFDLEERVYELVCDEYTMFGEWETIQ